MNDVKDLVIKILDTREEVEKEAQKYDKRDDVTAVLATEEEVKISKRNFSGVVDDYNERGYRQFSLKFTDANIIAGLLNLGWPLSDKSFKDEDGEIHPLAYLTVYVNYENERKAPIIKTIAKNNTTGKLQKTVLSKEEVKTLDGADISNIKLKLSRYSSVNSRTGKPYTKAYLSTMHCTIKSDEFDEDEDEIGAEEFIPPVGADGLPFDVED